ncbi:PAS domain-containing sensor histidine kinase [Ahrensia sp. 13_GOM-1096m]|uniref:PAS domain-containing sensor histidine kinase n=1 Tax=Ahrensia sp. 13_GOM-1096m TaxID=1380380 RepID=UPI000685741B|nr:PAS domain-containing sensor histidine kinase [Ahrensia sp. 13_GOM-1096m]
MSKFSPHNKEDFIDLHDLFEHAPCGYLTLAPNGLIVNVNHTFCTWSGYEKDDVLGKKLRDLLNVVGRIFYETHFAPLLRMQGYFDEVALDLITPDESRLAVLANASERRDSDGNLEYTRVTLFRATERRRYERQLVDARENAEALKLELENGLDHERQTAELREKFIAVLGHDLRNPLAAINSGARMLMRREKDEEKLSFLHLIQTSSLRMAGIIENVLDFARGRLGGGMSINIEYGKSLTLMLDQVVSEIRTTYPDRIIETEYHSELIVDADHSRIAQMFSNLLGNAVSHGRADSPIQVSAKIADNDFVLAITNDGDPIPPAELSKLFEPFHCSESSSKKGGLGLGLYISTHIAQAHNGKLVADSQSGKTTLTFSMPVHKDRLTPQ